MAALVRTKCRIAWLLAASALLGSMARQAAAEGSKGAETFAEECGDCHSVTPGKNKKGPSLGGIVGRSAGSAPGYAGYSDAMKQAGYAWTSERLDAYIAQPRKALPGGRMKYDGLADAQARADVILYLTNLK